MNIDYKDIADNILCGVDYDIYKDDCNEMDNELRNEMESTLIIEFKAPIDKLTEENKRMREALTDISNMCVGEIAMGYRIDAQFIGEVIHEATGMTNPELNKRAKAEE